MQTHPEEVICSVVGLNGETKIQREFKKMKEMTTIPLSMRRNCNLDLCLLTPSPSSSSIHRSSDSYSTDDQSLIEGSDECPRQLTIFFDGRICSYDVTELQARTILSFARREMDERMKTPRTSEPASPVLPSQLHSPNAGISMKRSLQRFLQKRKNRIQATSHPYSKKQ